MPREYIDPSTIDWSQYRPVQKPSIDVNKLNPETSNLQEGLKSAGKFTAGLASTAAGGIAAPEALAGRIMEGVDYLTGAKRSDKYLAQRKLNQQRPAEIRKNISEGHKGFEVITENVSIYDDLKRRDFTINSIAVKFSRIFPKSSDILNPILVTKPLSIQ